MFASGIDLDLLKESRKIAVAKVYLLCKVASRSPLFLRVNTQKITNLCGQFLLADFPQCRTLNELNKKTPWHLLQNGCVCVSEGANMPSPLVQWR
jgi:glutamate dehydrogenase (NADP+)